MAAQQYYANHAYRATLWLCAAAGAVTAVVMSAVDVAYRPSRQAFTLLLLSITIMVVLVVMRRFALRLQNRIIRMEMDIRLTRLGQASYLSQLTMPQIIASRFASDGELPALLARAVAEKMTSDQIKRAVTTWQADELRT